MVISCSAYGCTNKWSRETKIHFHKFPFRSKKLCDQWVVALKRKDFIPTRASLVCSDHFKKTDYVRKPGIRKKRLKRDAVPSKFKFPVHELVNINEINNVSSLPSENFQNKKRGRKPKNNQCPSFEQNISESFIEEIDVDKVDSEYSSEDNGLLEEFTDDDYELMNVDEEDKCYILGSIWGERLKLLPVDVRHMVRQVIDTIFEEARNGSLENRLRLWNSTSETQFK